MDWQWRGVRKTGGLPPARSREAVGLGAWLLMLFSFLAVVALLELVVSFGSPDLANGYVLVNGGAL